MKPKIFFLTRSYIGFNKGGGPRARYFQVKLLEKIGYEVIVVLPDFKSNQIKKENNLILIPGKFNPRITYQLAIIGIIPDYLNNWVKNAYNYLKNVISKEDIIFATTGSEIGTLHLGYLLSKNTFAKLIISYHDPIQNTSINKKFYKKQILKTNERIEKKVLQKADLIITSSKSQENYLRAKTPNTDSYKFRTIPFGYFEPSEKANNAPYNPEKIIFGYGGSMGSSQRFETVLNFFTHAKNHELWLFGQYENKHLYNKYPNIKFHNWVSQKEYNEIFLTKINIGIACLCDPAYSVCIPSKIYDYINLNIPIFGFLYPGHAKEIIKNNSFGVVISPNSTVNHFKEAISLFEDYDTLIKYQRNLSKQKDKWYFYKIWSILPKTINSHIIKKT